MNKKVLMVFGAAVICFLCLIVGLLVVIASQDNKEDNNFIESFRDFFGGNTAKAIDFNNEIVREQQEFSQDFLALNEKIGDGTSSKEEAEVEYEEVLSGAQDALASVNNLDPVGNGEELKSVAVEIFEFYTGMLEDEYRELLDLFYKEDFTEADLTRINELQESIGAQEEPLDEKFQAAQEAYAEDNGFALEELDLTE